jgi:hypothetical protein
MVVLVRAVTRGSLSAQFLAQTVPSFIIALLYMVGAAPPKLSRAIHSVGF